MASLDAALSKVLGKPLAEHPEAVAQQLAAHVDAKGEGIVILVDQLEEIVTLLRREDAKAEKGRLDALDLLSRLAEAPVGLRVIVAARRDLLDGVLAVDPHFSRALSRGTQQLSPALGRGLGRGARSVARGLRLPLRGRRAPAARSWPISRAASPRCRSPSSG